MYLYDIVKLFTLNDKSQIKVVYKKKTVYCGRVDYLQFNHDGMLDPICNKAVSLWYVEHNPVNPKNATRTVDNKYIIIPNIITVVVTDPVEEIEPIRTFGDIPDNNIKLRDIIGLAVWVIPSFIELMGQEDDNPLENIIRTSELLSDMHNMNLKGFKPKRTLSLPNDIYDRGIIWLDLSNYYVDPEKDIMDASGFYSEPKPRLSIQLSGSLMDDENK